jgi:adenine-specific DNA glycosylase
LSEVILQQTRIQQGNVYRILSRVYGIETPINSTDGKKDYADFYLPETLSKPELSKDFI